jgi:hypothetical protein
VTGLLQKEEVSKKKKKDKDKTYKKKLACSHAWGRGNK